MAQTTFDIVILGSGPAGLQSAIHASRRKVSVLVLGKSRRSSAYGAHIENLCCTGGRQGAGMLDEGLRMAQASGAAFREEDVTAVSREGGLFAVTLEGGEIVVAGAIVLAMGVSRETLGVPGEKEFLGRGVSYCVDCDGPFFRNESVAVVGGESAAVSGALTLLFWAARVHLVARGLEVAEALARNLRESAIVLHEGRTVRSIEGDARVERLVLDDGTVLKVAGVFIELGAKGALQIAGGLGVALDPETFRYVAADRRQATNVPGVWAAGDITGPPWQVAKAVGEGGVAGLEAAAWVRRPPG
jgi:thioredoxin reductase (NADPH)